MYLTWPLKHLGRSVGRRKSIAQQAMGDQKICTHVLTILDCEIQMEVKRMRVTMKSSVL